MLFKMHDEKPSLGLEFAHGEAIIREGEPGDCLYVILEGRAEVVVDDGSETPYVMAILERDSYFGEMSMFTDHPRVATVRALGPVRVMSVDKRGFLRWMGEDPSFSMRIMIKMAERIRSLIAEVVRLRTTLRTLKESET
ncbi:MAG: cyclic nucleotide-binding domain-containing protein [Magnetococcales bacterium]|nr:cyclic nucleotide-binding domain-containing protein [Magnetococcales bacterium]MBF0437592.1 cyclic nucleotide-binding domain-containing protein [Magnetococcales bacterium]